MRLFESAFSSLLVEITSLSSRHTTAPSFETNGKNLPLGKQNDARKYPPERWGVLQ